MRDPISHVLALHSDLDCLAWNALLPVGEEDETTQKTNGEAVYFNEREEISFFFEKNTV